MRKEKINKKDKIEREGNRKISFIITIIVIIIAIVLVAVILVKNFAFGDAKDKKATEMFGNEKCNVILHMSTMDLAPHTCKICGTEFQDSSMHADICKECAEETNRCDFCGKKMTDEIKAQRESVTK